ncbi:MAG: hypothetical protein LBL62_03330 [Planctomycetaceae bacterium]|nr:hypothetical protein [Planctomycetaceae bacterium]
MRKYNTSTQNAIEISKAVLKFAKLDMVAQQREAVIRGRSLLPIPATV